MTFIGLSALKNLRRGTGSTLTNLYLGNSYQAPYSAPTSTTTNIVMENIAKEDGGGYAGNDANVTDSSLNGSLSYWLANCVLSNVAMFDYALSATEAAEIWAARSVW